VATGFILHRGKRIYLVDAAGGIGPSGEGIEAVAARAAADIRREPPRSVLVATKVDGVPVTMKTVELLKKLAEGNGPHVKAACVVGLGTAQRMVFQTVRILSRREFELFDTLEQGLDYLAGLP